MTTQIDHAYLSYAPTARKVFISPNPLPLDIDWHKVEQTLDIRIVDFRTALLGEEIVNTSLVDQCKPDLLDTETQEVDRCGEFPDSRVGMVLEFDSLSGCRLTLTDGFLDKLFAAARHSFSPLTDAGTTTPGNDPSLGGTGVLSAEDTPLVFGGQDTDAKEAGK